MNLEVVPYTPKQRLHTANLVLVHTTAHGAWCWERFASYLAERGYQTTAFSLRGHGTSEGSLNTATMQDYVADLAQIVAQTAAPVILVGHALGGWIVQRYLEKHQVAGAVLMASFYRQTAYDMLYTLRRRTWPYLWSVRNHPLQPPTLTHERVRQLFFSKATPDSDLATRLSRFCREPRHASADLATPIHTSWIQAPILVQSGLFDNIVSPITIRDLVQVYNADEQQYPAAHDLMLEPGFENVADGIIDWITARGLGQPITAQIQPHPLEIAILGKDR